jgi:hypothetical protein
LPKGLEPLSPEHRAIAGLLIFIGLENESAILLSTSQSQSHQNFQ